MSIEERGSLLEMNERSYGPQLWLARAAAAVSRGIQSGYHGIERLDGLAFGGAAAGFLVLMLIAGLLPARRASRVDPLEALKDE